MGRFAIVCAVLGVTAVVLEFVAYFKNQQNEATVSSTPPVIAMEQKQLDEDAQSKSKAELASREEELTKLWQGIREFGNVTRVKAGNCWVGQYRFNDPKSVTLSNEEWEILMRVFCYLQGQEYQCEQVTAMESPVSREDFLEILSDPKTLKLLGDEIIRAIQYDTEHEIEYHGNSLSKLPSIALIEKKFDIVEQESGVCDNE